MSEKNSSNINDSSSSSIEQIIHISPHETSLVQKFSFLSLVFIKRKESHFTYYPKKEQEKVNKILKENLTLDTNDSRDENDLDFGKDYYKLLP
jgi:hypothetical protein